jgi:hypothetical protein
MPKQTEKLGDWRVFKTAEAVAVHAAEWLCSVACGRNGEIASVSRVDRHLVCTENLIRID